MNAQEWEKLSKNYGELTRSCLPSEIVPKLFEKDVITCDEKDKIDHQDTRCERMKFLLQILRKKPREKKPYSALLDSMRECGGSELTLANKIDETQAKSDCSLKTREDPHVFDDKVRDYLNTCYRNELGVKTALYEIKDALIAANIFRGKEWPNEMLRDFICDVFAQVEIQEVKKRAGKNSKKVIYMINIGKCESNLPSEVTTVQSDDISGACGGSSQSKSVDLGDQKESTQPVSMDKLSPLELKQFLLPKFKQKCLELDSLNELVTADISGDIFLTMTEEDIRIAMPSANFGTQRFLTMIQSDFLQKDPDKRLKEGFRNFDSDVKLTNKYVRGRLMDITPQARGKKTTPVRNFHLMENQDKDNALEYIGSEVVPFASACLNDRRNGTIYFGISPSDSDSFIAGEIVGVGLSKEDVIFIISDFLQKSFFEDQMEIINSTIREARFVPVVPGDDTFVIEIDVCPSTILLQDAIIRTKLSSLSIAKKKRKEKVGIFRFLEGHPNLITPKEIHSFEKDRPRITHQRRQEEAHSVTQPRPNLRQRLLNQLTAGEDHMGDAVSIFLMTSPIDEHMDQTYMSENMQFIKDCRPEIVFDFDPNGSRDGIHKNLEYHQNEVTRVINIDNFDRNAVSKEDYKKLTEGLSNERLITWAFCNGHEELGIESYRPIEWNRKRRAAIQELLKFYIDTYGEERIIFIVCLFSKMYETMIEAFDEVLAKPIRWILLAENEDIAKLCQDEILSRNKVDKKELSEKCVIGMSWGQVKTTIQQVMEITELPECRLPSSTGCLQPVWEKKLKDWCDLDVLSAGSFDPHENNRKNMQKKVENKFYKGEEVEWLNFWFSHQVCRRDIHDDLKQIVQDALRGKDTEEEEKVSVVPLLHQPGAGGTTSAKQVLWELRKEYRCCVVKKITDETCEQLDDIRRFKDDTPKPLLILVDNADEDKWFQLRGRLEGKGRKRWRDDEAGFDVYCVILQCVRLPSLPKQKGGKTTHLKQELTPRELAWFKEKNDTLTNKYKENSQKNVNPKFLISFNILRENFNKKYISKVVQEFSDGIQQDMEVKLLKIVSLLNTYDPDFRFIKVSCLDQILMQSSSRVKSKSDDSTRDKFWEANLTQGIKVLLNLSSNNCNRFKAVRVFNKLIASEILLKMKERTGQKESAIMRELFDSGVFDQKSADSRELQSLINNVVKKREVKAKGQGKHKFSLFVMYVQENEGAEVAAAILETLFKLNEDPFTAQLVARFYICLRNWDKAEDYAKRAISELPSNSFLWDTYGQVFKHQLYEKITTDKFQLAELKDEGIHELIALSEKCIAAFRKEQKISEKELTTHGENNFAGYFGEMRAIVLLLNGLQSYPSFQQRPVLHEYLVKEHFQPAHLSFLTENECELLKGLEKCSGDAMRRLDEEYLQMKGGVNTDVVVSLSEQDNISLIDLKVNFDLFFGENSDSIPVQLSEGDQFEFRRRRARQLGATSMNQILQMRRENEKDTLNQIYKLLRTNVASEHCDNDNILSILNVVTALLVDGIIPEQLTFENVLEWARELRAAEASKKDGRTLLEKFLYFVMYNFPTEERQKYDIQQSDLKTAIEQWNVAFKKNYPNYGHGEVYQRKRETTFFFLGNGEPLKDIVHQDSLTSMSRYSSQKKWQLPEVRQKLRLMEGNLKECGKRIVMTLKTREGNTFFLDIPTSHPVKIKHMKQKKVYFYLGFSFAGPKGFGLFSEKPRSDVTPGPVKTASCPSNPRPTQSSLPLYPELTKQIEDIHKKLASKQVQGRQQEDLLRKKHALERKITNLIGLNV